VRRRDFIALLGVAASSWSLSAHAQQPPKIYRLGYLAPARIPNLIEALQTGLRELGYVEGKNLKIEYRFGGHDPEAFDDAHDRVTSLSSRRLVDLFEHLRESVDVFLRLGLMFFEGGFRCP
jgi:hypothetical protein